MVQLLKPSSDSKQRLVPKSGSAASLLRLSLSRAAIELHGGAWKVEDRSDGGSALCLTLPLADPKRRPPCLERQQQIIDVVGPAEACFRTEVDLFPELRRTSTGVVVMPDLTAVPLTRRLVSLSSVNAYTVLGFVRCR